MLVVAPIDAAPLVLVAIGQVPGVGAPAVVTGTMIVHVVAGFTIWSLVTTMVLEPAAAVTVPPLQVPVAAAPVATRPAGSVSVNEKVCVGLFAGTVSVKVRLLVAPTAIDPDANALVSTGAE